MIHFGKMTATDTFILLAVVLSTVTAASGFSLLNPSVEDRSLSALADAELLQHAREQAALRPNVPLPISLVYELGIRGVEDSLELLRGQLESDYGGRVLSQEEEAAINACARSIGLLAMRSESAFAFLLSATDPVYWSGRCSWKSTVTGRDCAATTARACIKALGISGRDEVPALLEQLAARDQDFVHAYAGAIADAAMYHWRHIHQGREAVLPGSICSVSASDPWLESPEGQRWRTWLKTVLREKNTLPQSR